MEDERQFALLQIALLQVSTMDTVPRSVLLAKIAEVIELIRDGGAYQGVLEGQPNTVYTLGFTDSKGNPLK